VVTGVAGGYDVNVRQMAADGVTVVGRVLGAFPQVRWAVDGAVGVQHKDGCQHQLARCGQQRNCVGGRSLCGSSGLAAGIRTRQ